MNIIDSGVDTTLEFPICHYCRKRVADKEWSYFDAKLYWINKRTVFPLGYSYTEKIVPIPRCDKCHSFHNKVWNKSGLIGFPIGYGLAAWVTFWANDNSFLSEDGSWYGSVFATIFFGTFITGLIMRIIEFIITSRSAVPSEELFHDYPAVDELIRGGWIDSRPDAANHPETGEERRIRLQHNNDTV